MQAQQTNYQASKVYVSILRKIRPPLNLECNKKFATSTYEIKKKLFFSLKPHPKHNPFFAFYSIPGLLFTFAILAVAELLINKQ